MYAKLVFPETAKPIEICRDVVNCIITSDGAGGLTTASLDFVDAPECEIIDTDASGWSLRSGFTINTGPATIDDTMYELQTAHDQAGKSIVVRIETGGSRTDSAVFETNTSNGIWMVPVVDPDTSEEIEWSGYTGTNTARYQPNALNTVIHIFASPKRLIIIGNPGTKSYGATGKVLYGILASKVNNRTQYENMAPYMYFRDICGSGTASVTCSTEVDAYLGRLGETYSDTQTVFAWNYPPYCSMIDAVYDANEGYKFRTYSLLSNESPASNVSYNSATNWDRILGVSPDGTASGTTVSITPNLSSGIDWQGSIFPCQNPGLTNQARNQAINATTGASILKVFPVWWRCQYNVADILDFSHTEVYHTYGGQGSFGDTMVLDGQDYFYADTIIRGAWAIKKA